jgi:hypothetical protein
MPAGSTNNNNTLVYEEMLTSYYENLTCVWVYKKKTLPVKTEYVGLIKTHRRRMYEHIGF